MGTCIWRWANTLIHFKQFSLQTCPLLLSICTERLGIYIQVVVDFFIQFKSKLIKFRYSIYGTIDIPWAIDKHTIRSFTVISHLNLNMNPAFAQAYGVSEVKILCCGPCKSDPITANFSIVKSKNTFIFLCLDKLIYINKLILKMVLFLVSSFCLKR